MLSMVIRKLLLVIMICLLSLNLSSVANAGLDLDKLAKEIINNISSDKRLEKELSIKKRIVPMTIIYPNGNYYYGQISYLSGKEDFKTEYHKYKMRLDEAARINLHFISHVDDCVEFQLIDADENIIKPFKKRLYSNRSPFTRSTILSEGEYTFIVYKMRSRRSNSNTGEYRFKFEKVTFD